MNVKSAIEMMITRPSVFYKSWLESEIYEFFDDLETVDNLEEVKQYMMERGAYRVAKIINKIVKDRAHV